MEDKYRKELNNRYKELLLKNKIPKTKVKEKEEKDRYLGDYINSLVTSWVPFKEVTDSYFCDSLWFLIQDHEENLAIFSVLTEKASSPVGPIKKICALTPGTARGSKLCYETACGVRIKESDLIIPDHELSFRETE